MLAKPWNPKKTTLIRLVIEPIPDEDDGYGVREIPVAEKALPNWLAGDYWLAGAGATLITGAFLDTLLA